MLDSSERLDLVIKALALVLVATIITYAIYPYLYTIFEPPTPSGRDHRFEVIVNVGKHPEDDPWDSNFATIFGFPPTELHSYGLSTSAGTLASSSVTNVVNISTFYVPLDYTTYYYVSSYTVRSEFVFTSTTSAAVYVIWTTTQQQRVIYIPTRTFNGGLIYRWSFTVPAYVSTNLVIPVHTRPKSTNSMGSMSSITYTTKCFYLDPQSGATLSSTSGLSFSLTTNRVNATHVTLTYRITFGTDWNSRIVQGCVVYTTSSGVVSDINSVPARNMNIQSPVLLLYHMYTTTVYTGDMFTYVVWYVTPASL